MTTNQIRSELNHLFDKLPPERQREVADFAAFLIRRQDDEGGAPSPPRERHICFEGWAGRLSHVEQSAVEMQHRAMKDWIGTAEGKQPDVSR